jgi:hypothetical protein
MKLLLLALIPVSVFAHQMDERECRLFATDAALDKQDRERGVTMKEQLAEAAVGIPKCQEKPNCAYKDDEDTARVVSLLNWIYSSQAKDMDPQEVYDFILPKCLDRAQKRLPGGAVPSGPQIGS